jgi:hypothetical protein
VILRSGDAGFSIPFLSASDVASWEETGFAGKKQDSINNEKSKNTYKCEREVHK